MAAPTTTKPRPRRPATVGISTIVRQLRAMPTVPLTIVAVVLLAAFLLVAGTTLFDELSEDALETTLAETPITAHNLAVDHYGYVGPAPAPPEDPLANIPKDGDLFVASSVPPSVGSLITETVYSVESFQFEMLPYPGDVPPAFQTFMRLRAMIDIGDHVTLVEGHIPEPRDTVPLWAGSECPLIEIGDDPHAITSEDLTDSDGDGFIDCEQVPVEVFEVVFTQASLNQMGLEVGDQVVLQPDFEDRLYHPVSFPEFLIMDVSGIIEIDDPDEPYWYGDTTLHTPVVQINPDRTVNYATGLFGADDYSRLLSTFPGASWTYGFNHFLDLGAIDLETAPALASDVRLLQTDFPNTSVAPGVHAVTTNLAGIIDEFFVQRDLAFSLMSMSVLGVLAVTLAIVWLLAALLADGQERSTVQLRSRGGSRPQLTRSTLIQAALLVVPAVAVAYLISIVVVGQPGRWSPVLAVALAGGSVLFFLVAASPATRGDLASLQRKSTVIPRTSTPRVILEALIIVLAIGALAVIRRRTVDGIDLLVAAGPLLLAFAVAVVTLRLYVLPIRFAAWLGSKRSGVVGFVGFQRVLQQAPAARLPLAVILITVAVAVSTQMMWSSINQGQADASYQLVGADYRVTGSAPGRPVAPIDLSGVKEVEATSSASLFPAAAVRFEDVEGNEFADLLTIEGGYEAVVEGTPADVDLPEPILDAPTGESVGTRDQPIPAIVSSNLSATRAAAPGLLFSLLIGTDRPIFEVIEIRDRFPGLSAGAPFVVAPTDSLRIFMTDDPVTPTILYARAPATALEAVEGAVDEQSLGMILTAQAPLYERINEAPMVSMVDIGLRLSFIVSTLLAVVAAVVAVVLLAPRRQRDFGYMGTMGLSRRQGVWMTFIEQVPPVVIASLVGGVLGIGMGLLLRPVLDINPFVGPGLTAVVTPDLWFVGAITLGLIVTLVVVILMTARADGRDSVTAVRLGDD